MEFFEVSKKPRGKTHAYTLRARATAQAARAREGGRAEGGDEKRSMLRARAIFHPYYNAAALYLWNGGFACYGHTKIITLICRVDHNPSSFLVSTFQGEQKSRRNVLSTEPQTVRAVTYGPNNVKMRVSSTQLFLTISEP